MASQKKHIIKYLFLAFSPILLYNAVNLIYLLVFVAHAFPDPQVVLDADTMLPGHYFEFDAKFCFIMLVFLSIWLWKIRRREPELQIPAPPHMLLKIPVITLGMNGISSLWFIFISFFLESIPLISNSLESFDDTWSTIDSEPYSWVLLSVVLAGPIVEELLFRGIMFHYLEKIKRGWFPILISGVVFGLWHLEPVQVVYAALLGIILGIVYAKTRDIRLTFALHILNNFLSTLPPFMDTDIVHAIIFYASFLMVIPTLYILIRMARGNSKVNVQ